MYRAIQIRGESGIGEGHARGFVVGGGRPHTRHGQRRVRRPGGGDLVVEREYTVPGFDEQQIAIDDPLERRRHRVQPAGDRRDHQERPDHHAGVEVESHQQRPPTVPRDRFGCFGSRCGVFRGALGQDHVQSLMIRRTSRRRRKMPSAVRRTRRRRREYRGDVPRLGEGSKKKECQAVRPARGGARIPSPDARTGRTTTILVARRRGLGVGRGLCRMNRRSQCSTEAQTV